MRQSRFGPIGRGRPGFRRWPAPLAASAMALGLSACATDPAFLEGLALATNAMAAGTAQLAEETRCVRHVSLNGEVTTICPLPAGYVAPPPYLGDGRHDRYPPYERWDRWDRDRGDKDRWDKGRRDRPRHDGDGDRH